MNPKTLTPADLRTSLASDAPPLVFDIRRSEDRAAGPEGITGAEWRDPSKVDHWAKDIPAGGEVVLYCVRGGSVSQSVQAALESRGVSARYVEGGLEAWRQSKS